MDLYWRIYNVSPAVRTDLQHACTLQSGTMVTQFNQAINATKPGILRYRLYASCISCSAEIAIPLVLLKYLSNGSSSGIH